MIISKTPLRISFTGGGSDIKEYYQNGYGAVVSAAINKFMYVAINKTFDQHIRVIYSSIDYVDRIQDIKHELAREAFKLLGIDDLGIELSYMGDIWPAHTGSGLGGSSTLAVGILNVLHAYKGERVSAKTLAEEACEIEINRLCRPIGKQDQYIAAYGGFNYIRFNKDESVAVTPINMERRTINMLKNSLMLFYTGLNTGSDGILMEQRYKIPSNVSILDEMVELSKDLYKLMFLGNLKDFGEILHEGWVRKQKLSTNITNVDIDNAYNRAIKAGATGGKILGSGGGGFLLLCCEEKNQDEVRKSLAYLRESPFHFEPKGSIICYTNE